MTQPICWTCAILQRRLQGRGCAGQGAACLTRILWHRQPVEVVAVGHTHIDVAWLWDHCQTKAESAPLLFRDAASV